MEHQQTCGHQGLVAFRSGLVISETHPFLGASPDACVHDPLWDEPFGLAEIKCPYSQRNRTPEQACTNKGFFCTLENGVSVKLKRNHPYYSQIQGQLAITQRKWCDFVIYTPKSLSIERIPFDNVFWESELLPKLTAFFDTVLVLR